MQTFKIKDYNLDDTIAAPATFPAQSALGVVRISGKQALKVASRVFRSSGKKDITKAKTHTLHYGWIKDKGQPIDEVVLALMRGPRSYTTEDVVEISCHGGVVVSNKIMDLLSAKGVRLALPGEFTYRALVYGRLDLFQAESVGDIVAARSETGLKVALGQLRGQNSPKIDKLKEEIKELFAQSEACLNFPEDEVDLCARRLAQTLKRVRRQIAQILAAAQAAQVLRQGARCVIVGRTNTGKSTLFNRLLKEERVIVSRSPGTTRDVVEETVSLGGVPLRIYDTAGILEARDLIGRQAIKKTKAAFNQADLVILVLDGSRSLTGQDRSLLGQIKDRPAIVVINKVDLKQKIQTEKIKGRKVKLSALKNIGVKGLERAVHSCVWRAGLNPKDMIFLSRYQRQMLQAAGQRLAEAEEFLRQGHTLDFVNRSLADCLEALGKVSGEVFCEDILASIFTNFCIGK